MRPRILALLLTSVLVVGGCVPDSDEESRPATTPTPTPLTSSSPTPDPTPSPAATTNPKPSPKPTEAKTPKPDPSTTVASGTTKALKRLKKLRRIERSPNVPQYRRDEFGPRWADVDGNGCNQRDDVLLRDAIPGTVKTQWQGRCDHDVIAGSWKDPYTGATLTFTDLKDLKQAQAIHIDHVVALSEAWKSGAHEWPYERRVQFANRLNNLLAVDGPTNMRKGDADPAAWRPRKGYQCSYAKRWINVKHQWNLGADESEVRALEEMLGFCKK